MFRISPLTMQVLAEFCESQFLERMKVLLRTQVQELTGSWSASELDSFVQQWVADARAYRISLEKDIGAYLCLVALNPVLQKSPRPQWVLEALDYPDRTGARKLELLKQSSEWQGVSE